MGQRIVVHGKTLIHKHMSPLTFEASQTSSPTRPGTSKSPSTFFAFWFMSLSAHNDNDGAVDDNTFEDDCATACDSQAPKRGSLDDADGNNTFCDGLELPQAPPGGPKCCTL